MIASRQYLGHDDNAGPAVLITRKSDRETLLVFQKRFQPLLAIFDAHALASLGPSSGTPTIFYHESIFAPELARRSAEPLVLHCFPDARFERFCSRASLCMIEPLEPEDLTRIWKDVDGALQALIERLDQRRDRIVLEIYRAASRLRNLLLSLPVGIEAYEQALLASGQPESLWYVWSITQPLQALESRIPEIAALGEWEELILRELVDGFQRLVALLRHGSPKREPLVTSTNESLAASRRVALVVTSPSVASGSKWVIRFPQPHGLGLSPERVTAITPSDIDTLDPDHDCIVHEVFDPHTLFSALARAGPRRISFILMRNELRFVGERLLRSRQLFPDHPANDTILYPIYQQVERLEPVSQTSRRNRTTTLFSDSDYEMVMRMFNLGPRMVEHGTVLTEDPEHAETGPLAELPAYLFHLKGQSAVFLDASGRLSYVRTDDSIVSGPVNVLEAGHRLIIINPAARESIAHRILTARREQETDHVTGQTISRWRQELSDGIRRHAFTYNEMRSFFARSVSPSESFRMP